MSIVSSEMSLASNHRYSRVETSSERLRIRVGERVAPTASAPDRGDRQASGRVLISLQGQARAAAERAALSAEDRAAGDAANGETSGETCADCLETAMDEARKDPANQLLIALVEYLSGRSLSLFRLETAAPETPPQELAEEPAAVDAQRVRLSIREPAPAFSLDYSRTHSLEEHEATTFSARGLIRTADGARVCFDLQLEMQRSYREVSHTQIRMGTAQREDPLVINFSGTAAQLRDQRFEFDLDADGELSALPLLASGSGYLAFDRNGDGRVNDGSELFGALSGDGYADLKALDEDGNGWIDAADTVNEQLYLWLPEAGGDGKLLTLEEAGIAAISTANVATPFELRGQHNADLGAVRATGLYLSTENRVGTTQQIDLSV
ncbi:hypothetical protein [Halochromatium salexigens]|uniref:VCBS repeat-containing protein n=1 Tax=Halochromatium salexigens TaxID=49447 RepID=A0AAJ0UK50_HALSE|nr:hypothetical protein [Halochromatium salexigens]MBK5931777.1 hypothetical protein [Halochromatium salexigens]